MSQELLLNAKKWLLLASSYGIVWQLLFFVFCCFLDQIYMKRFFSCFEWNHFFRRHRRLYFNKLQLQYVKNAHIANILIIKDQTAFTSHWERKKTELSKNLHTIHAFIIIVEKNLFEQKKTKEHLVALYVKYPSMCVCYYIFHHLLLQLKFCAELLCTWFEWEN